MMDEKTAKVELHVPQKRLSTCSAWISTQPPSIVADVLDLSQGAYNALSREVGKGEVAKVSRELAALQSKLVQAEQTAKEKIEEAVQEERQKAAARLEDQQRGWSEEIARERDDKTFRLASLKERETSLVQEIADTERASREREAAFRAQLQEQETQLGQALEAQKAKLLEEQERALSQASLWHQKDLTALEDRYSRVAAELNQVEQKHSLRMAEERELLKESATQQVEQIRKEMAHELAAKVAALEQQTAAAGKYWEEVQRLNAELRELAAKHSDDIKQMCLEKESIADKYLGTFRGSTAAVGQIGEDFVAQVHADLNLGSWTDTSRVSAPGHSDAFWEVDFANCSKLSCLVEVKNSQRLHSVHDIKKFTDDVSEAGRQGRINCALLISLSARIPDTRPLQLSLEYGVVILRASRSASDHLPPRSLVETALNTLATAWPLVQRHRSEQNSGADSEVIFNSVAELFEAQLAEVTKLSKQADELDKNGRCLQRIASQVRKSRDALAKGVDTVRIMYPQLVLTEEDDERCGGASAAVDAENMWLEPGAASLLDAIFKFKESKHGRYPKTYKDLAGTIDSEATAFVDARRIDVKDAVARAKAQVPKGQKRARTEEEDE